MSDIESCYRILGLRIRCLRRARELTQEQLADKLGMTRASVANIETGKQRLMLHDVYTIAAFLKAKPDDLLNGLDSREALEKLRRWKRGRTVVHIRREIVGEGECP